jgi:hypothetical protein
MRFVSVCGMLGYGYPEESLERAVQAGVDFLGADAGSTDPGPYYLGSGSGFVKSLQVRRDLTPALLAARRLDVPLIIGTAGGSGAAPHLEAFLDILRAVAREQDLHFRLAVIPADLDPDTILEAMAEGRVRPCANAGKLKEEDVRSCTHLVGQMGTDPVIRALDDGADVIVAGRCCDTAIFAAAPIREGFAPGPALHLGKIAECGALCARPAGANDALVGVIGEDGFVVEPANEGRRCTPESVASHSLYEQPDPNGFHEPEGRVDVSSCTFEPHGERGVRVSGTRLVPSGKPTVKVEGAALRGYRSITVAGIRDPGLIEHIDDIEHGVREAVAGNLAGTPVEGDFSLRFLRYGLDAVTGRREPPVDPPPREVGLVIEAVAATRELADTVVSLARSTALHQHVEGRKTTAGNLAFPFSPSDLDAGPVYEFAVYHLMETRNDRELFNIVMEDV